MKISELQSYLEDYKNQFGDVDVSLGKYDYTTNLVVTTPLSEANLFVAKEGLRIYSND